MQSPMLSTSSKLEQLQQHLMWFYSNLIVSSFLLLHLHVHLSLDHSLLHAAVDTLLQFGHVGVVSVQCALAAIFLGLHGFLGLLQLLVPLFEPRKDVRNIG